MMRSTLMLAALICVTCAPDEAVVHDGARTYESEGSVVSIEDNLVLIDHEDIPGFMDAMTMTFPVSDRALLEGVERGMRVKFRVVVDGANYSLDRIEPIEPNQP